jgi:hypothetical protein
MAAPQRIAEVRVEGESDASSPQPAVATATAASNSVASVSAAVNVSRPAFYLALLLPFLPLASVQKPMLCPKHLPGKVFQLPKPLSCQTNSMTSVEPPIDLVYKLYKHNVVKYQTRGWLCRGVVSKVRAFTYLFGDEHLKESSETEVMVTRSLCNDMIATQMSPAGPLIKQKTGLLQTQNRLKWEWPSWGLPSCCKWHEWQVTNYFVIPNVVSVYHNQNGFECSVADVSNCAYSQSSCQLGSTVLLWSVSRTANCQFTPFKAQKGKYLNGA